MGFISSLFRGTKGFSFATNALLAEHILPSLTPAQKDQVRTQITHILHAGGPGSMSPDFVYRMFNSQARAVQLNVVALALNDLGIDPPFKGEFWHPVRNPFMPGLYNEGDFEAVQARLAHQHGQHFQVGREPLHIMDF